MTTELVNSITAENIAELESLAFTHYKEGDRMVGVMQSELQGLLYLIQKLKGENETLKVQNHTLEMRLLRNAIKVIASNAILRHNSQYL